MSDTKIEWKMTIMTMLANKVVVSPTRPEVVDSSDHLVFEWEDGEMLFLRKSEVVQIELRQAAADE